MNKWELLKLIQYLCGRLDFFCYIWPTQLNEYELTALSRTLDYGCDRNLIIYVCCVDGRLGGISRMDTQKVTTTRKFVCYNKY